MSDEDDHLDALRYNFMGTRLNSSSTDDVYEQDWGDLESVEIDVEGLEEELHSPFEDEDARRRLLDEQEFSFSFEFTIDSEPVVCNHCSEVNDVADPMWLHFLDSDPSCTSCGYPLGIVR